jgi:hypothetical protein
LFFRKRGVLSRALRFQASEKPRARAVSTRVTAVWNADRDYNEQESE